MIMMLNDVDDDDDDDVVVLVVCSRLPLSHMATLLCRFLGKGNLLEMAKRPGLVKGSTFRTLHMNGRR